MIKNVWDAIEQSYGVGIILKGFNIIIIETEILTIKRAIGENQFSLSKKSKFSENDEETFHQLVGFEE